MQQESSPGTDGPSVAVSREARMLRVVVRGVASVDATRAYWSAIVAEAARDRPDYLLLVDELRGPALGAEDWRALVDRLVGTGLEAVRIAHVKPNGLDAVEHCELSARQHGFEARVFVDERAARLWLRYGERPDDRARAVGD
ncbi:hypothetical protein [Luteimonas sp. MC1895]|uniref:hypothetical protein n=1 Tax=Luteimonas sp. MC1895 TaxID=2819513 RepID=UPI0018F09059|nr:hypothetical protein [Luteimonas sp. MC1895]MBJ6979965.1 hypothetical protein [Luteimonas sp. MC1895]